MGFSTDARMQRRSSTSTSDCSDCSRPLVSSTVVRAPNTQFRFLTPVGKLFGAGGIEVLHREVQSWPNWFFDWSTKATIDWSKTAGLQLGDENHLTIGVRPLRGVSVTAEGNLNLKWEPMQGTGSITPSGGVLLKLDILQLLPH